MQGIAALLDHGIEPCGREPGVLRQGLEEQGPIRIKDRGPRAALGLGHARLREHPIDRRVMDAELGGNGVRPPLLDEVAAQYLRFQFLADRQCSSPDKGPLRGPQKLDSEEGVALPLAQMAINPHLGAMARGFLVSLPCV